MHLYPISITAVPGLLNLKENKQLKKEKILHACMGTMRPKYKFIDKSQTKTLQRTNASRASHDVAKSSPVRRDHCCCVVKHLRVLSNVAFSRKHPHSVIRKPFSERNK